MEDLPLGRIAALVPEFAVKDLPLGRTLGFIIIIIIIIIIIFNPLLWISVKSGGPS